MRNYADALRPGKSPITTTRPNSTSRNANTSKNNTTTSNALTTTRNTSRKCLTISASDCTRGANQPGHQGQEWLTMITQLDGTGGHEPLSKMA
jgi:hypothetical protein